MKSLSPKLALRSALSIATVVLLAPAAEAKAMLEWVSVIGTSQSDSLEGILLSPSGEILCSGRFGYTDYPHLAETELFKYDSRGQFTATRPYRGGGTAIRAMDSNGNYFVAGSVGDPDLLGSGRVFDFYLAEYSSSGTLLWERTAGTLKESERTRLSDGQNAGRVALDAEGSIYVAGESIGPAVFGDMTFPNTVGGPLLCKFASDGTLLWARRAEGRKLVFGGEALPGGSASTMALDPAGNIIISGSMIKGKAVFDDITINITATYDHGAFVAKYSPAGQIIWAKPIPFGDVAVDQRGNTFISGPLVSGQANFDGNSIPVPDPFRYATFVAKFNPAGELLWAKAAPNGGLLTDRTGNIYSGSAKLNPAGDLLWARVIPGATLNARKLNNREEPVFVGTIQGSLNLDGISVSGDRDGYDDLLICRADVNGTFQWAFALVTGGLEPGLASGNVEYIQDMLCDGEGNLTIAGPVRCPWSFPQQTYICDGVAKLGDVPISVQMGGNNDFWLARISDPAPPVVELKLARTSGGLSLSWPAAATGFALETTDALPASAWSPVNIAPVIDGGQNVVSIETGGGTRFFRLRKP